VFIGCGSRYEESEAVFFGAPFDSTTSFRPGARFGCSAMRTESVGIETYSPYQERDLSELAVFDAGDLELPFGNACAALAEIENFCSQVLDEGRKPVMAGGEHLVTLGALRAAVARHPGLALIHFDAHADLRDGYMGEKLSHAAVIRRAWEAMGRDDGNIYQFGIRSGAREEFEWASSHVYTERFKADTAPRARPQTCRQADLHNARPRRARPVRIPRHRNAGGRRPVVRGTEKRPDGICGQQHSSVRPLRAVPSL